MRKRKKDHEEINYWQSNTDMMSALVLVLLLIIMLLILYLMKMPENDQPDSETGDSYNVDNELGDEVEKGGYFADGEGSHKGGSNGSDDQGDDEGEEEDGDDEGNGGGGGGSGTGIGTDPQYNYEYPLPTHNGEDWNKAAVYATVVDQETGRAIREEGITFELYEKQGAADGGALRFLNTYYPEKIEYRNYETTEEGVFYLPEKIEEGHYYFKQITELEGYDMAEAVQFDLDDIYDWPDPYVVSIEVSPSKNIIPISLEDMDTHEPVSGGTFKIVAAEDIITADNTVRYAEDETADTVALDKEGYGESKELYLGTYTVTQKKIPKYYASIKSSEDVEVEKKDGSTPETLKFICEKTKISLKLTDNLYTNVKLEGAEFELTCKDHPKFSQTAVTDENGEIVFTNLKKRAVYLLKQVRAPKEYRFKDTEQKILVDEHGRIEDEAEASYALTNYILRASVNVKDKLFGKPVSDVNLALYEDSGKKISTWTASGTEKIFEDLPEGNYYILANGDKDKKYEFKIADESEIKKVEITVLTMQNIVTIAAGGCILLLAVFGMSMVLKRRKTPGKDSTGEMKNGE